MPRKAKELSPLEVHRLVQPGRWSVGGVDGLALQVTSTGARSWVLRIRATAGRRREMGLGSFPSVTVAQARDKARQHRALAQDGIDPIAARQAHRSAVLAEQQAQKTFSEVAAQYIAQHEKSWKNAKHQAQWAATLRTYAEPSLGRLLVRDIRSTHVSECLSPSGPPKPRLQLGCARASSSCWTTLRREVFETALILRAGREISMPLCRHLPRWLRCVITRRLK